jgi:hypothetical protein
VEAVHDPPDCTGQLVVQAAVEGMAVPSYHLLALCRWACDSASSGYSGSSMTMMFGAAPSQHPTDRGGDARALRRRLELRHRLTLRRKAGRKEPLVRVAGNDPPAVAQQFVGEALGVTDAKDLCARVMAETPGWKRRPGQMRLQLGAAAR